MSTFEIDQRPREVTMTGEQLCAYLRSQAWEDFGAYTSEGVTCRRFALGRKACDVPLSEGHRNHGRMMVEAIDEIARAMGGHSMDVVDAVQAMGQEQSKP